jgi:hypothetical protein
MVLQRLWRARKGRDSRKTDQIYLLLEAATGEKIASDTEKQAAH